MRVRLNPACDELGMVVDRPLRKQQKKDPKSQSKASEAVIEHAFVNEPPSISQPGSSENTAPSKQCAKAVKFTSAHMPLHVFNDAHDRQSLRPHFSCHLSQQSGTIEMGVHSAQSGDAHELAMLRFE
ncbi:hypothetical protein CAPTEDRAFT_225170 [Capitella teleta]|uniref:Uncharacterized protein n=1 Tax=Capitella teleta TaxID=283909 RepID=R7UPX4_CAPTE|nr:hypothetical protein CAPTEDRAFT_225170 [Capitella teleta]|eukprot:ELU08544.1 hypothetical protein CAPTEDRAFT_225170 [Capitella teleta]